MKMDKLPLLVTQSTSDNEELHAFATERRDALLEALDRHGGLLLRGFRSRGIDDLAAVATTLGGPLMPYIDRAAHRTHLKNQVYTAADYPPTHEIHLHNESTYARHWPTKLFLYCICPAQEGGHTPIADVRKVRSRLPADLVRRFADCGVMYVRNFGIGRFGPTWQDAFQTDSREEVDAYCHESDIRTEWIDADRLRTTQIRPALLNHPRTSEEVWFNHAATLHVSSLPARTRRVLMKLLDEPDYPSHTYYGDGAPIEADVMEAVRDAYAAERVLFDWQAGDLLVLDNILTAHGRMPFKGRREVVVAMTGTSGW